MSAHAEFERLKALSKVPVEGRPEWLSGAEAITDFLIENARADHVVLYASTPSVFIHGVLAPVAVIDPLDEKDLLRAHLDLDDSWSIVRAWGGGEGHRVCLEPPLAHTGCRSLIGGEKLVFIRNFEGVGNFRRQIELSQKLVHSLNLHLIEERHSYCRLDDKGDFEDVITVLSDGDADRRSSIVLIATKDLAEYMALSGQGLVRKFDCTRVAPGGFNGWKDEGRASRSAPDMFYDVGVMPGHASYANGCQVIRTKLTPESIAEEWKAYTDPANKRYETFKIQDWKNNQLVECSCAPGETANYFTQSNKPFEISPAFFRPEVLGKYKADPDKYRLEDRSISCRNSWYLKTYDINEAGQVHTYIVYLRDLPYEEQQYWKLYNEWPKGPISKRAFENDIEGTWVSERDPLQGIRHTVDELDRRRPPWWNPRGDELSRTVHYPATDSSKEWGDELLALDQLIVEGFLTGELRKLAGSTSTKIEPDWQSLKLIEVLLAAAGTPAAEAPSIMEPLRTLHALRSKVKGHAVPAERRALEKSARSEHSTLRAHYQALASGCDAALTKIVTALDSLVGNDAGR